MLTVLATLFVAGCGAQTATTSGSPTVQAGTAAGGDSVPAALGFTATTVDGASFDASSLAGSPAVFWFWAPWCPTCRAQAPGVQHLAEEYGDRVGIVGVGGLDQEGAIAEFARSVPDITQLVDPEGAVWRHFEVTAQSTYVVLDADGATASSGYLDDGALADLVAELAG